MFSDQAIKKVLSLKGVNKILDMGAGQCEQSNIFAKHNRKVTAIDIAPKPNNLNKNVKYIQCGFDECMETPGAFDCVWASHLIEHTLDLQHFLKMMNYYCKEGGYIAITFPPLKHQIVGGHVNLLNPGVLLYRLVLEGLDTKNAMIKQYGYNISVILKKRSHEQFFREKNLLKYDNGDIETISEYLPKGYNFQGFNGDIKDLNW